MMKNAMRVSLVCAMVLTVASLFAETRVYSGSRGTSTFAISKHGSGYKVVATTPMGTVSSILNSKMETIEWTMVNQKNKTDVKAVRTGDTITVSGSHKGKQIQKEHDTKGRPWHQNFALEMEPKVKNGTTKIKFVAIAPAGPMIFNLGTFNVKKLGDEKLLYKGSEVDTHAYQFDVAPFWKCTVWYRKDDGKYIKFEDSRAVVELQ